MRNDFRNDASYEERVEQFRQEQKLRAGDRAGTTYHALAGVDQALEGGRFAAESRASIVGETPNPYPKLPASSPWAGGGDVGLSPPLGVAIDEQEPVGTPTEIERSLAPAVALASATAGEMAEPADPSASSPGVDRGSAIHARLQELLGQGIVRRRKL
jgi:hypothetical protein